MCCQNLKGYLFGVLYKTIIIWDTFIFWVGWDLATFANQKGSLFSQKEIVKVGFDATNEEFEFFPKSLIYRVNYQKI